MPNPPTPEQPTGWEHFPLWKRVREALFATPIHFTTPTNIEGLPVRDLFTLNTTLAATIEESFVKTLNNLRPVWDPESRYQTCSFVRQSQTFPDVVLRRVDNGSTPLMGVELKGWYLFAREGVPTFRFSVTAEACSPQDLIVVVPWVLSNVLAGSPVLFPPFVESARYCALLRNHYWEHERKTSADTGIDKPQNVTPYPSRGEKITDKPRSDPGGNFGRIARYGAMNQYVKRMRGEHVLGVPASAWVEFFTRTSGTHPEGE